MYSCDGKAEFLVVITPVFSVTRPIKNLFNMVLKKYFENSCAA